LDAHKEEVIVMWMSKHGSECAKGQAQYPGVPLDVKRAYWKDVMQV
jgi:hypothetical protein